MTFVAQDGFKRATCRATNLSLEGTSPTAQRLVDIPPYFIDPKAEFQKKKRKGKKDRSTILRTTKYFKQFTSTRYFVKIWNCTVQRSSNEVSFPLVSNLYIYIHIYIYIVSLVTWKALFVKSFGRATNPGRLYVSPTRDRDWDAVRRRSSRKGKRDLHCCYSIRDSSTVSGLLASNAYVSHRDQPGMALA